MKKTSKKFDVKILLYAYNDRLTRILLCYTFTEQFLLFPIA